MSIFEWRDSKTHTGGNVKVVKQHMWACFLDTFGNGIHVPVGNHLFFLLTIALINKMHHVNGKDVSESEALLVGKFQ